MLLIWTMLAVLLSGGAALAETVTLKWDQNPAPDLAGYKLYQHTKAGNFIKPVILGQTVTTYTTPNLTTPGELFWLLTAYDKAGNESKPSAEVSKVIIGTPVVVPPVVLPIEKCMSVASATTKEITIKLVPCVN